MTSTPPDRIYWPHDPDAPCERGEWYAEPADDAELCYLLSTPEREAARELADALEEFRAHVIDGATQWRDGMGSHHHPVWSKVSAALAKAKETDDADQG